MRPRLRGWLLLLVVVLLGHSEGCRQRHPDRTTVDGAVLRNALCNYAVDHGWAGLVDVAGVVGHQHPGANRALVGALLGRPPGAAVTAQSHGGGSYIQRGQLRIGASGMMLDHWGRPYRIAMTRRVDERGQTAAVELAISSCGRDGVDDNGRKDDQTWSTVIRW